MISEIQNTEVPFGSRTSATVLTREEPCIGKGKVLADGIAATAGKVEWLIARDGSRRRP